MYHSGKLIGRKDPLVSGLIIAVLITLHSFPAMSLTIVYAYWPPGRGIEALILFVAITAISEIMLQTLHRQKILPRAIQTKQAARQPGSPAARQPE